MRNDKYSNERNMYEKGNFNYFSSFNATVGSRHFIFGIGGNRYQ